MEIWFSNPQYLWLLAPIPVFAVIMLIFLKRGRKEIEKFISPHALEFFFKEESLMSRYIKKNFLVFIFRALTYTLVVFVITGSTFYYNGITKEQAMVVAIDASGSMLTEDIMPNRLEAVKETISIFLEKFSPESRIAALSFSGNAYIEQKLSNKEETMKSIKNIQISPISGTSIGAALKTAATILKDEKKPKLIMLISDGSENIISEQELNKIMDYMNEEHITVNVIGVGKIEGAKPPGTDSISILNEPLLENIAKRTNGIYIRAETTQSLTNAYKQLISSAKLKIPIMLTVPLILLSILLILVDYIFIMLA